MALVGRSDGRVDEWTTYLIAEPHRAPSTIRNYQTAVRLFRDYVTSPHHQWPQECQLRFGTHPVQLCHAWNTAAHLVDYEAEASRRPMPREEFQYSLDHADAQVDRVVRADREGALAAYRDATAFKVVYGWGPRCAETSKLDFADWYRNPKAPELSGFGRRTCAEASAPKVRRPSGARCSVSCRGRWRRSRTASPTSAPATAVVRVRRCGRPSAAGGCRTGRSRIGSRSTATRSGWTETLSRTDRGTATSHIRSKTAPIPRSSSARSATHSPRRPRSTPGSVGTS